MIVLLIVIALLLCAGVWLVRTHGVEHSGWLLGILAFAGAFAVILVLMVPEGGGST